MPNGSLPTLGAESVRGSYGSYAGGADGGSFYLEPLSPDMFEYPEAPSFSGGSNADTVNDLYDQMLNYGDFTYGPAPEYTNRWDDTILGLIDEILGREDFAYDPDADRCTASTARPTYAKGIGRQRTRWARRRPRAAACPRATRRRRHRRRATTTRPSSRTRYRSSSSSPIRCT